MDVYLPGLVVYFQPILWMALYYVKRSFDYRLVFPAGALAIAALWATGFKTGPYSTQLLTIYVTMVMIVTYYYRRRPGLQPISLAFLVVFLNSFYWEFPIHVADLISGNVGVFALQCSHLYVVPFLLMQGFKLPRDWGVASLYAWVPITFIEYVYLEFRPPWVHYQYLLYLMRFIGLYVLLWILRFPDMGEDRVLTKIRDKVNRWRSPR